MVKRWTEGQSHFPVVRRAPRVRPGVFPERTLVMSKKITMKAGSGKNSEPRLAGSIVKEVLQGWNRNTELSVDLKTLLRKDVRMVTGKVYQGVLRRDADAEVEEYRSYDPHFTFTETLPQKDGKRNPHLFVGKYITITRRDDGSLRPNFKPMKVGAGFSVEKYALGVYNELLWALEGLVEK